MKYEQPKLVDLNKSMDVDGMARSKDICVAGSGVRTATGTRDCTVPGNGAKYTCSKGNSVAHN